MITDQLILNHINRRAGIPVLNQDGSGVGEEIAIGTKVRELFLDVRVNPNLIYDRVLEYIGDSHFKDENGNEVQTFAAALVLQ